MWYYSTKLLIRFPVLLTMWFPFHWRLMSGLDYRWIIALWYLGKLRWCIFQIHRDLSMFRDGSGGKKRKKKRIGLFLICTLNVFWTIIALKHSRHWNSLLRSNRKKWKQELGICYCHSTYLKVCVIQVHHGAFTFPHLSYTYVTGLHLLFFWVYVHILPVSQL